MQNKDLLISLGATHVLDRKLPAATLKEQATRLVGKPIPYVFDAVSIEETQQAAYDLLAPGGTLAVVTLNLVKEDESTEKKILMVHGSFHPPENRALGVKFAAALTTWLAEGKIKVRDGVVKRRVQDGFSLTRARPTCSPTSSRCCREV